LTPVDGVVDELLADAWPARLVERVGRWRYRWTDGVTRRANSVLAVGDGALDELIARAEDFYQAFNAPTRFQVSAAAAPSTLARLLVERGLEPTARTLVAGAATADVVAATTVGEFPSAELTTSPSDRWLAVYSSVEARNASPATLATIRHVLLSPRLETAFASVVRDGVVGVGQLVIDRSNACVQCMTTRADARSTGVATAVLHHLARLAAAHGASTLWLAVMADNMPARGLYERAGFAISHEYCYYEAPPAAPTTSTTPDSPPPPETRHKIRGLRPQEI